VAQLSRFSRSKIRPRSVTSRYDCGTIAVERFGRIDTHKDNVMLAAAAVRDSSPPPGSASSEKFCS